MQALRATIYGTFAVSFAGLALPESKTADVLWVIGSCGLLASIGVWILKSSKNSDYAPQRRGVQESDFDLPWPQILRKIARLRLHYLLFLNIALCAFAASRGQELWLVLIAALFSAAFLFLIGQAIALGRFFTNLGAVDRENTPRRFRANVIVLMVLYVLTSALPFIPSGLLAR